MNIEALGRKPLCMWNNYFYEQLIQLKGGGV